MITEGGILSYPWSELTGPVDTAFMRRTDCEEFTAIADALLRSRFGCKFWLSDGVGMLVADPYGIAVYSESGPAGPLWVRS